MLLKWSNKHNTGHDFDLSGPRDHLIPRYPFPIGVPLLPSDDYVTWPWMVNVVTLICLVSIISKICGDWNSVTGQYLDIVTKSLFPAVSEITGTKHIGVTTLTFQGHETSSVTWPSRNASFDSPWRVEWSLARWRHVSGLLIRNWLHIVTPLSESIKLLGIIEKHIIEKNFSLSHC